MPHPGVLKYWFSGIGAQEVHPKKSSCKIFPSIFYVETKWSSLRILRNRNCFKRQKYAFHKELSIEFFLTSAPTIKGFGGITNSSTHTHTHTHTHCKNNKKKKICMKHWWLFKHQSKLIFIKIDQPMINWSSRMQPTKIELIYHTKLTYFHIWISKFCNKKDAPAEYWFIVSTLKLSYKWLFQADCFHQIFYPFLSSVLIPTSFKLSDILCSLVMKVNRTAPSV